MEVYFLASLNVGLSRSSDAVAEVIIMHSTADFNK